MTTKHFFSFLLPLLLGCMTLPAAAQKTTASQASNEESAAKPKGPLGVFKKSETTSVEQRSAKPGSDVKTRHQQAKKEVRIAKRERKAAQAREEAARARAEMIRAEKRAESAEKRSVNADKRAEKARRNGGIR